MSLPLADNTLDAGQPSTAARRVQAGPSPRWLDTSAGEVSAEYSAIKGVLAPLVHR